MSSVTSLAASTATSTENPDVTELTDHAPELHPLRPRHRAEAEPLDDDRGGRHHLGLAVAVRQRAARPRAGGPDEGELVRQDPDLGLLVHQGLRRPRLL